jgi:hypothetical protein
MTGTESSSRGKRLREQVVKDALDTLDWDALQAHLDEIALSHDPDIRYSRRRIEFNSARTTRRCSRDHDSICAKSRCARRESNSSSGSFKSSAEWARAIAGTTQRSSVQPSYDRAFHPVALPKLQCL